MMIPADGQCSKFDFIQAIKRHVYAGADVVLTSPLQVSWQVTSACNLACRFCYAECSSENQVNRLTRNAILHIADELGKNRVLDVSIEGGEPFLFPWIFDCIRTLKRYPIAVDILTNGTLIDDVVVAELEQCLDRQLDSFQISIDGPDETVNSRHRTPGSFNKVLDGIKRLTSRGFHVRTNTVVSAENVADLPRLFILVHQLGVRGGFGVAPVFPVGRGKAAQPASPADVREVMAEISALEQKHGDLFMSGACIPLAGPSVAGNNTLAGKARRCTGGRSKIGIDPEGNVLPCVFYDERYRLGNLVDRSLADIWSGSDTTAYRDWVRSLQCQHCDSDDCNSACIAMMSACPGLREKMPNCLSAAVGG